MDVKKFHKTATAASAAFVQKLTLRLSTKAVRKTLRYPFLFLSAHLLSQGTILGGSAPFGLAFAAACGSLKGSLFALIGSSLGYLGILDKINSLKYIACIILIYTAHFVFKETSLTKSRLFAPCSVFIPTLCINLVFLADSSFPLLDTISSFSEIILATVCAHLFFSLFARKNQESFTSPYFTLALLSFISSLLIPLSEIVLPPGISPGKILAVTLSSLSGFAGGCGAGCITGMSFGCAVGLSEGTTSLCMLYGLVGIISGVFSKKGRLASSVAIFVTALSVSAWTEPQRLISLAIELTFAVLIFLATSEVFVKKTRRTFAKNKTRDDSHLRSYAKKRLTLAGDSFHSLGNMLKDNIVHEKKSEKPDISSAFDRAASQLCKKCTLASICWERDYSATKNALNDATAAVRSRGELHVTDLPSHFSSRCIHIERFVDAVNRELLLMMCRRQMKARTDESKKLLCRQYSDISDVLLCLASDISENEKSDDKSELEICDILTSCGVLCDAAVYRDAEGHANIHLCGRDLADISNNFEKYKKPFADALGVAVEPPIFTHGDQLDDILIRETPPFRSRIGASVHRRTGSEISGDSGSFFKPSIGKLAIILADGMGSGREAASDSATVISLLEGLLKSGIPPKSALATLNSALILKTEHTGSFSTLDLVYLDLFSGNTEFYKFGSAPTYIKRGRHVRRITSSTLPTGITTGAPTSPDSTIVSLIDGDFVVIASDGVADVNDDAWLMKLLSESEEINPKSLADELLAHALTKYGRADDMTVIVTLFEQNPDSKV